MKKVFLLLAAVAAMTFVSCGNTTNNNDGIDSTAVEIVEDPSADFEAVKTSLLEQLQAGDASAFQEKLAQAQAYIQELINSGKLDVAKEYAAKLQQFIADNKESIQQMTGDNETINGLIEKIQAMPTDALDALKGVATDAEDAAQGAVDNVKDAATGAAKDAKEAIDQAATDAVDQVKDKTAGAIDDAAEAAKKKLGL